MKTHATNYVYLIHILTGFTALLLFFFFTTNQLAHAAGTSSTSSSASESSAQKRERANQYFEQGKILQDKSLYKQACEKYERAVKIDPSYAQAHSNLGYTYRKQHMFDKAVRAYKKAIKLDYNLAEAHEYLGEAYAEMGKFDLAQKELAVLKELGSDEAAELEAFIIKMKKQ